MRVAINLASRQFADVAPAIKNLRIAMGALALVAIALGFGLHALHDKAEAARQRAHSLDGQIAPDHPRAPAVSGHDAAA